MNFLTQYKEHPKSLTKVYESMPQWDNGQIYGKECIFKVENWGHVKMFFLNFTLTPSGITSVALPTSPYLIENVFLECNGVAFCRANTTYTIARIDDLKGSGLYDQIMNSSSVSGTFDSAQTVSLPLFFFVIDRQVFDPSLINNLTVRVITKRDRQSMGMGLDLSGMNITLTTLYNQAIDKQGFMTPCSPLKNFYNIMTDEYVVSAGTNNFVAKLNSPSKVKNLFFMIRRQSDAGILVRITSVKIRFTNGQESTFSNLNNFTLSDTDGRNDGSTFKVEMEDYIKLNGNMRPTLATVYYSTAFNSNLYIVYEYESMISSENGNLLETFEESVW